MKKITSTFLLGVTLLLSSVSFASTSADDAILDELKSIAASPAANYIYGLNTMGDETVLMSLLIEMKKQTMIGELQLVETKKTNELLASIMVDGSEYPSVKH